MTHVRPIAHLDTFAVLASLWPWRNAFDAVTLRQTYPGSPHKDTRSIFLRGPEAPTPATWFEDVPHVDYPILAEWPEMQWLLKDIAAELGSDRFGKVMLVELAPGGAVSWHVDEGAYAVAHDRYHLPLTTNPGAFLLSGGEQLHIPVGFLTGFDNHGLHSAINVGPTPRVHLIVDVRRS